MRGVILIFCYIIAFDTVNQLSKFQTNCSPPEKVIMVEICSGITSVWNLAVATAASPISNVASEQVYVLAAERPGGPGHGIGIHGWS